MNSVSQCLKSELDLCRLRRPAWRMATDHALTSVGDNSPIEFEINGNGEDYIDLANSMLYVRAKITW